MGPQSDNLVTVSEGNMSQSIKVDIYGQVYPINAELEETYVRKIAAYVDEKMRLISDVAKTVDTQKVAVLAALAIADELHRLREERGEREEILKEQAERCLTLVERALRKTE
jgi:cell division protein ZapA